MYKLLDWYPLFYVILSIAYFYAWESDKVEFKRRYIVIYLFFTLILIWLINVQSQRLF